MGPTLQRTYSKAKGVANRVVWTSQESIPVSITLDGLVSAGAYALLNITGRPQYCSGYQLDFAVPGQDPGMLLIVSLLDQNGNTVPGSTASIYGTAVGAFQPIAPAFFAGVGTTLQFNVEVVSGIGQYLPQCVTLTYFMNFANGFLNQTGFNVGTVIPGSSGGSGGGGGGTVTAGNYGGSAPPFTPTVTATLAIDTSNGQLWEWYNSTWH